MILLETSLLSLAYEKRSGPEPRPVAALRQMVRWNLSLAVPGIVWQELLAGVRSEEQRELLKTHLAAFPILLASEGDHVAAARIAHDCRAKRIACSAVEALIAAHAVSGKASLFTLNPAFAPIARVAAFELFDHRGL
ncbi:MAG TPA: PIN domain-containing protein [Pirellulales bacterium]|jgi:predicted nucleic acid-binding protein|nr:PIN domain-containing protein [Pirellulales bacterium]